MSNSNTVTLPREVVERVLHALWNTAHGEPCFSKNVRDSMAALRAALVDQPDAIITTSVPTGWKLVPVEPTIAMLCDAVMEWEGQAVYKVMSASGLRKLEEQATDGYRAMLAAAPQPPELEKPPSLFPLPADLYDSKDWRCGTYSERVEWLHTMYESAKEQIAALEKPQPEPTPYLWYDPKNGDTWTQEAIDEGFAPTDNLIALYTK